MEGHFWTQVSILTQFSINFDHRTGQNVARMPCVLQPWLSTHVEGSVFHQQVSKPVVVHFYHFFNSTESISCFLSALTCFCILMSLFQKATWHLDSHLTDGWLLTKEYSRGKRLLDQITAEGKKLRYYFIY